MFAAVCVSMCMCTINNMTEGFLDPKVFRDTDTDTRAQLQRSESSEGSTKDPSVSTYGRQYLQLYQA